MGLYGPDNPAAKLIGYLVIFLNLEKYIIYLKSLQNPYQLYDLKRHQNVRGRVYIGAGVAWPPAYLSAFKACPRI